MKLASTIHYNKRERKNSLASIFHCMNGVTTSTTRKLTSKSPLHTFPEVHNIILDLNIKPQRDKVLQKHTTRANKRII